MKIILTLLLILFLFGCIINPPPTEYGNRCDDQGEDDITRWAVMYVNSQLSLDEFQMLVDGYIERCYM